MSLLVCNCNTKYIPAAGAANIDNSNSLKQKAKVDLALEEALATKKQKIVIESTAQKHNPVGKILDSQNYKNSNERPRLI